MDDHDYTHTIAAKGIRRHWSHVLHLDTLHRVAPLGGPSLAQRYIHQPLRSYYTYLSMQRSTTFTCSSTILVFVHPQFSHAEKSNQSRTNCAAYKGYSCPCHTHNCSAKMMVLYFPAFPFRTALGQEGDFARALHTVSARKRSTCTAGCM